MATAPRSATHCPYCALQCAMTVTAGEGREPEIQGRDFPTNAGSLCRKGWSAGSLLQSPERLGEPLLRGPDGQLHHVSWPEALDTLADRIEAVRGTHGPDGVALFGGGSLTNEKAYQLGKFARLAVGTSRVDYNGRFCMSSAAAAGNRAFGLDRGLPFPLTDLGGAGTILLLGSNVAETMPPFVRHLQAARDAGGLIVVDPRRTATAELTGNGGGVHLQPTPGTDLQLLLGLCHVVLVEGLADEHYLARRTSGRSDIVRTVAPWWPERVQGATGVPAARVREIAHQLADAAREARSGGRRVYVLTGRGIEQHVNGTDTTTAAINLALLLGLPGTTCGGYGTLTGQGNGQGGREHGQKCDQLPGYRKITDPAHRAHVAGVWGVDASAIPGPGLPATELLHGLGKPGGARMLLVHGANVAVSAPDATRVIEGLRRLDFLVVADFFLSETAAMADLVLPVLQWAEEEGTMTNLEGRVLRRRRTIDPPPEARSELWIFSELARRLGAPGRFPADPREVFEELRAASAGGLADYSGITYAALDDGAAMYWPCPATPPAEATGPSEPGPTLLGTPRLFLDRFAHADGRARLVGVRVGAPAEQHDGRRHLTLLTGRLLEHYQSGSQTRRTGELLAAQPEPRAELHPTTALELGVRDGEFVSLNNQRGRVLARVQFSTGMRRDAVFLPFHFAGSGSANLLTDALTDPLSGMPAFKNTFVTVEALVPTGLPPTTDTAGSKA